MKQNKNNTNKKKYSLNYISEVNQVNELSICSKLLLLDSFQYAVDTIQSAC